MADDWQIGDLALCVDDRICPIYGVSGVKSGRIYSVDAVTFDNGPRGFSALYGPGNIALSFDGIAIPIGAYGFDARRFRKVTPPSADDFDREVIEQMSGEGVPA